MTWQRFVVGWVVLACVVGPVVGRWLKRRAYICEHCCDEGRVVVNEQPPRWAWCNFCMLGQQLEAAAERKHLRVLP